MPGIGTALGETLAEGEMTTVTGGTSFTVVVGGGVAVECWVVTCTGVGLVTCVVGGGVAGGGVAGFWGAAGGAAGGTPEAPGFAPC